MGLRVINLNYLYFEKLIQLFIKFVLVSIFCRERSERPTLRCSSFSLSWYSYPGALIRHVFDSREKWWGGDGMGAVFLSPISSQTARNFKKLKIQYESR